MPTPTKEPKQPVMEKSLAEFGGLVAKLKKDLFALVQGDTAKIGTVLLDVGEVLGGLQEFVLGLDAPPMVGSTEAHDEAKTSLLAECNAIQELVNENRPTYGVHEGTNSATEGAKINMILKAVEALLPFLKLFVGR